MLSNLIESCPIDYQTTLAQNIILAGGSTCFKGFDARLKSESEVDIEFRNQIPDRKLKNWIGAAESAKLSAFQENFVTK